MSGADVLRQVREALDNPTTEWRENDDALAALDGCVLLTREEANMLIGAINGIYNLSGVCESLALLTPTKEDA